MKRYILVSQYCWQIRSGTILALSYLFSSRFAYCLATVVPETAASSQKSLSLQLCVEVLFIYLRFFFGVVWFVQCISNFGVFGMMFSFRVWTKFIVAICNCSCSWSNEFVIVINMVRTHSREDNFITKAYSVRYFIVFNFKWNAMIPPTSHKTRNISPPITTVCVRKFPKTILKLQCNLKYRFFGLGKFINEIFIAMLKSWS